MLFSFSNPSVAKPTSQLILQPFRRFTYVTGTSHTSPGKLPMPLSFIFSDLQLQPWATISNNTLITTYNLYLLFLLHYTHWGRRLIGISGSLTWSKTLMELMFNPCGEFRWSLEGPVSQIHSPHLLIGAPGIFSDFLKVCSDAKERERVGCGKQREAIEPINSPVKQQPWFLSLWWKTCLRQKCSLGFSACNEGPAFGQNSLMMIHILIQYRKNEVTYCIQN